MSFFKYLQRLFRLYFSKERRNKENRKINDYNARSYGNLKNVGGDNPEKEAYHRKNGRTDNYAFKISANTHCT